MKYLILHADGMADLACAELGGSTPLQAAKTPFLDQIAQRGEVGLLSLPSDAGRTGSDVTGVAVLGYDPKKYYPGPGPLEAAGLGVTVGEQDVVFRCTMVTVRGESASGGTDRAADIKKLGPHVVMEDATAGLIETEQARELVEAVNEQLGSESIQFYPGSGHRHLMVWVGGKSRATCVDPQQLVGQSIAEALPAGDGADVLRKIMDASFFILRDHPVNEEREEDGLKPANCLWLWGQGRAPLWPPLPERYQVSGVVVSASDVHRGVGLCAGLDAAELPAESGDESETFAGCVKAVVQELAKKDFVYLHAGLSDDVLHATNVHDKVQAIERFDAQVIGPILSALAKYPAYRLLVVCDPGLAKGHGSDVPPILYALCDGATQPSAGSSTRFHEQDKTIAGSAPRDATKLMMRLFPRGA
ncbi:MAG TPA: 2,3-bisphosphoglycerate-independent phosphoglycerate mutase [Nitrospira sp.]|nr:2,3-bisphosphoglycerate-independent phosphoglycerate mutase [Nitrospira sp.]HND00745.1 2,3-bisphosphoglycerate-independent phosphoglycerate mutase [Nitrospira sp.]